MKDIEIVVFNDKSWVRLAEYQELIEKMQCCENCKHKQCGMKEIFKEVKQKDKTKTCDEWELAE
jgi:hypothetical protein